MDHINTLHVCVFMLCAVSIARIQRGNGTNEINKCHFLTDSLADRRMNLSERVYHAEPSRKIARLHEARTKKDWIVKIATTKTIHIRQSNIHFSTRRIAWRAHTAHSTQRSHTTYWIYEFRWCWLYACVVVMALLVLHPFTHSLHIHLQHTHTHHFPWPNNVLHPENMCNIYAMLRSIQMEMGELNSQPSSQLFSQLTMAFFVDCLHLRITNYILGLLLLLWERKSCVIH